MLQFESIHNFLSKLHQFKGKKGTVKTTFRVTISYGAVKYRLECIIDSAAVAASYEMLKNRLTFHGDISSYCLFLSYSIACDANIFPSIVRVTTGDVQLFGATQMNPRFFPSYLRFRKTRRITIQKQRGRRINCYILWHFCKLDGNWAKERNNKIFTPQH